MTPVGGEPCPRDRVTFAPCEMRFPVTPAGIEVADPAVIAVIRARPRPRSPGSVHVRRRNPRGCTTERHERHAGGDGWGRGSRGGASPLVFELELQFEGPDPAAGRGRRGGGRPPGPWRTILVVSEGCPDGELQNFGTQRRGSIPALPSLSPLEGSFFYPGSKPYGRKRCWPLSQLAIFEPVKTEEYK